MKFKERKRPGFLFGMIDLCTAGTFFLFYFPFVIEKEVNSLFKKKVQPYWLAYILGIPNLFIYTLYWMAKVCEDTNKKAIELGIKSHTSFKHMFLWNILGCFILVGPAVATWGFFKTLDEIERKINEINEKNTI